MSEYQISNKEILLEHLLTKNAAVEFAIQLFKFSERSSSLLIVIFEYLNGLKHIFFEYLDKKYIQNTNKYKLTDSGKLKIVLWARLNMQNYR